MAASDIVHTAKKTLAFEGASTDAIPRRAQPSAKRLIRRAIPRLIRIRDQLFSRKDSASMLTLRGVVPPNRAGIKPLDGQGRHDKSGE